MNIQNSSRPMLIENTLYSTDQELEDLKKDHSKLLTAFLYSFIGPVLLLDIASNSSSVQLYFKKDKKLRLQNITNQNNNSSLVLKLLEEEGLLATPQSVHRATRFLAKLKNGLDFIDRKEFINLVDSLFRTNTLEKLPPKFKKEFKNFLLGTTTFERLASVLIKYRKVYSPLSNEFSNIYRKVSQYLPDLGNIDDTDDKKHVNASSSNIEQFLDKIDYSKVSWNFAIYGVFFFFVDKLLDALKIEKYDYDVQKIVDINDMLLKAETRSDVIKILKRNLDNPHLVSILNRIVDYSLNNKPEYFSIVSSNLLEFMIELDSPLINLDLDKVVDTGNIFANFYDLSKYQKFKSSNELSVFKYEKIIDTVINKKVKEIGYKFVHHLLDNLSSINKKDINYKKNLLKFIFYIMRSDIQSRGNLILDLLLKLKVSKDVILSSAEELKSELLDIDNLIGYTVTTTRDYNKLGIIIGVFEDNIFTDPDLVDFLERFKVLDNLLLQDLEDLKSFYEKIQASKTLDAIKQKLKDNINILKNDLENNDRFTISSLDISYWLENSKRFDQDLYNIGKTAFILHYEKNRSPITSQYFDYVDNIDDIIRTGNLTLPSFEHEYREYYRKVDALSHTDKKRLISEFLNSDARSEKTRTIWRLLDSSFIKEISKQHVKRYSKIILLNIAQDISDDPEIFNQFFDTLIPSYQDEIRGRLVISTFLNEAFNKTSINTFAKELDSRDIRNIFSYNNIDYNEIEKKFKIRRKKNEDPYSYMKRVQESVRSLIDEELIPKPKVTEIQTTEDDNIKESVRLVESMYAGKHGNIYPRIHRQFEAHLPADEFEEFKKQMKEAGYTDRVYPAFHGTGGIAASMILRYGFKVIKDNTSLLVTGRMLGDGIYFTDVIDKALQYCSNSGYGRRWGSRGYIFVMDATLGKNGENYRAAGLGNDNILSPEWVVKDPRKQLKILKVYEVELVNYKTYKKMKKQVLGEERLPRFKTWKRINGDENIITFTFYDGLIPQKDGTFKDFDEIQIPKGIELQKTHRGPMIIFRGTNTTVYNDVWSAYDMPDDARETFLKLWDDFSNDESLDVNR